VTSKMAAVHASVRVFVLQAIVQNMPGSGAQLRALLTRHGLSGGGIGDPNARMDLKDYLEFFEDAAATFEDPVLGARVGAALRPGDLWPMGLLMMQASSIGSALGYYARYGPAFQTATSFSVQGSPEELVCSYQVHAEIKPRTLLRQDAEFTLACICSQIRTAFDTDWHPREVHLEHSSNGHESNLRRIFGAPVLFGQARNCIIVDREEAERVHRVEDRDFISTLNHHMASVIANSQRDVSASDQVRALVSVRLGLSSVDVTALASELGVTARTLQRRLAEEGTSLRTVLQAYREKMAEAYLAQGNMSIEEISATLGYAESTAFSRAFKTWTGSSPSKRESDPLGVSRDLQETCSTQF